PLAAHIPFVGKHAWDLMRRYNQMVVSGVLVEDSSTGTVSRGFFGNAMARYDITAIDHHRFIRGVKLLAELHFAMGAEYVLLPFAHVHRARSMDDLRHIDESHVPPQT